MSAVSLRNLLGFVRRLCACWVAGAIGLAFAATPAPVLVAPGIYALMGQPGEIAAANLGRIVNVAFVVGPRGVIVVESGVSFRHGDEIIAAVERITRKPIRLVVITHASQEAVFGAAAFQARGIPVWMHRESAALMAERCGTCLQTLRTELGERAMAGSRVAEPDHVVGKTQPLDVIGRRLVLIAPGGRDTTGALALWDETTGTLIAGSLVSIDRIPDLRDAGGKGWPEAACRARSTVIVARWMAEMPTVAAIAPSAIAARAWGSPDTPTTIVCVVSRPSCPAALRPERATAIRRGGRNGKRKSWSRRSRSSIRTIICGIAKSTATCSTSCSPIPAAVTTSRTASLSNAARCTAPTGRRR